MKNDCEYCSLAATTTDHTQCFCGTKHSMKTGNTLIILRVMFHLYLVLRDKYKNIFYKYYKIYQFSSI
jgi:hypothetical protein